MNRTPMGAFGQGGTPTIACINKATVPLGVQFQSLVDALQEFVDSRFAPVWGTPAKLTTAPDFVPGAWALALLDTADVQNALGYHDLTPDGLPLAKIFVKTTISDGQKVSVTASHELAEMLADPAINMWASGPDNQVYAYETADPVEQAEFAVSGIPMSDFVYPSYFEDFRKAGSVQFDEMRQVATPFQLLKGGYQIVMKAGKVAQVFGSPEKERRFRKEDRRGHRSECRGHHPLKVSVAP